MDDFKKRSARRSQIWLDLENSGAKDHSFQPDAKNPKTSGIVYNRIMYMQNPQAPQPILSIDPKTLDFGIVSADVPILGKGVAKLTVTNDGERILVGKDAIQVAWVSVFPPDFRLNPGKAASIYSLYAIRLR